MMTLFNDNWTFAEASIPEEKMYVNGKPNLLSPADFYETSKTPQLYKIPLLYSPLVKNGNEITKNLHKRRIISEYECIKTTSRTADFSGNFSENIHPDIHVFRPHPLKNDL